MNADRTRTHFTIPNPPPEGVEVTPSPRPWFSGPFPYHQPPCGFDEKLFLERTHEQPGHTFTETGRS